MGNQCYSSYLRLCKGGYLKAHVNAQSPMLKDPKLADAQKGWNIAAPKVEGVWLCNTAVAVFVKSSRRVKNSSYCFRVRRELGKQVRPKFSLGRRWRNLPFLVSCLTAHRDSCTDLALRTAGHRRKRKRRPQMEPRLDRTEWGEDRSRYRHQ